MFKIGKESIWFQKFNKLLEQGQTPCQLFTVDCRTDSFKNSFFPSTLNDCYKLDETIRNSESVSLFKSRLLSFIRPLESNVFNIFDPIGLTFLTSLCLGFSHLNLMSIVFA